MYTVYVTYKDETKLYYEVKNWEMKERYFCIKIGKKDVIFLPIYKIIEIEITKNN